MKKAKNFSRKLKSLFLTFSVVMTSLCSAECLGFASLADESREVCPGLSRNDGTWLFPTTGNISDYAGCYGTNSCKFCNQYHSYNNGDTSHSSRKYGHRGLDIGAGIGTTVWAAAPGKVVFTNSSLGNDRGRYIIIEHKIANTSYSYYSCYEHLKEILVSKGQSVNAGSEIAKSGRSGQTDTSYDPHLHFEIVLAESGSMDYGDINRIDNYNSGKEWLLTDGLREGVIVVNPSIDTSSKFSTVSSKGFAHHCGSVKYTFNASEVSIGGGATSVTADFGENFVAHIVGKTAQTYLTVHSDTSNHNVTSDALTNSLDQKWKFIKQSDGSYSIRSLETGEYLAVENGGTTYGTNVITSPTLNNSSLWKISGELGKCTLKSMSCEYVLDISNGSSDSGSNIQIWISNNTDAQYFQIKYLTSPDNTWQVETYFNNIPTRTLSYQSNVLTGDDVKWLQSCLKSLGYNVDIDGKFGPGTQTAVKSFQSDNGLTADGSFGPASREKMISLIKPTTCTLTANKSLYAPNEYIAITADTAGRKIKNYSFCVTYPDGTSYVYKRREDKVFYFYPEQGAGIYVIYCDVNNDCGQYSGANNKLSVVFGYDIGDCAISAISDQTYTGSALTPAVTVKDGSKTLTSGTDYTVSYSDNINAGTATVTITGKGNYTGTKTATFNIVKPVSMIPENVKAIAASANSLKVTWNAVTNATKYCVALYNSSTKKYTVCSDKITDTSYTITGLTPSTTYSVLVQAYAGKWSTTSTNYLVSGTTSAASIVPTNVKVTAASSSSLKVTWNAVANATKYCVALYNSSTKKYTVCSDTITGTSYTITGLNPSTTYSVLVQAYAGKWSATSTNYLVSGTTSAASIVPTNVKVTAASSSSLKVTWNAVANATKYCVALYNSSTKKYTVCSDTITGTSYTITGLNPSATYSVLVQAYAGKWSATSTNYLVSGTTSAASIVPTNVKVTAASSSSLKVTWNAVANATKYCVALYNSSTNKYTVCSDKITDTSYTITGLDPSTTYSVLVQAYAGKWSTTSTNYLVSGTTSVASIVPTNVKVTAASSSSLKVTWNAVANATKYCVALYNSSTKKYTVCSDSITGTSYTITGLNPSTTYSVLVQACVSGGWSSTETKYLVSGTTSAASIVPENVKVTAASSNSLAVTWNAVSGATKYCVALYNSSTKKYTVCSDSITGTSYTITGLNPSTTYSVLVQACVSGGWSSTETKYLVSGTTSAASIKPTNINVTAAGTTALNVTWNEVENASKYCVALYDDATRKYTICSDSITGMCYTITGLTPATEYNILVQACVNGKWSLYSTADLVKGATKA